MNQPAQKPRTPEAKAEVALKTVFLTSLEMIMQNLNRDLQIPALTTALGIMQISIEAINGVSRPDTINLLRACATILASDPESPQYRRAQKDADTARTNLAGKLDVFREAAAHGGIQ